MHIAVFDVNVLISSLIIKGKPRDLWLKARTNEFTLLLSSQIIAEFIDVISRRKFSKYVKEYDIKVFLEALHQTAKFTRIKSKFKIVEEDPADDIILRTAVDGKADLIVSGDKHLLALKEFRGIKILTADEMLNLLKEEKSPK
ncbi:MAG: putative toxin-antitoxin system toxin component, PIN family [Candidatus Bathyarchaeia archaeon]